MRDVKYFVRWPEHLALMEASERLGITEEEALALAIRRFVLDMLAGTLTVPKPATDRAVDESEALRLNGCRGGCCDG